MTACAYMFLRWKCWAEWWIHVPLIIAQELHLTLGPALFLILLIVYATSTVTYNLSRMYNMLIGDSTACHRQKLLTVRRSAKSEIPCASQQEITDTQRNTQDASAFWWASPALIAVMLWELISLVHHHSHSSRWLALNSRFPFIH